MTDYPAIFRSPSIPAVADALVGRWEMRAEDMDVVALAELLADTVYLERLRFEEEVGHEEEVADIDAAARAVAQGSRGALTTSLRRLVRAYAEEMATYSQEFMGETDAEVDELLIRETQW